MPAQIATVEDLENFRAKICADMRAMLAGATVGTGAKWMTIPEVADSRNVTVDTVRRWIREGRYEARGTGKNREVRV